MLELQKKDVKYESTKDKKSQKGSIQNEAEIMSS